MHRLTLLSALVILLSSVANAAPTAPKTQQLSSPDAVPQGLEKSVLSVVRFKPSPQTTNNACV